MLEWLLRKKKAALDVVKKFRFLHFQMRMVLFFGWLITSKFLCKYGSPVGIGSVMNEAVQMFSKFGNIRLLELTALISVAIGATNLVPFQHLMVANWWFELKQ